MATLNNKIALGGEIGITQYSRLKDIFGGRKISISAIVRESIRRAALVLNDNEEVVNFIRDALTHDLEEKLSEEFEVVSK